MTPVARPFTLLSGNSVPELVSAVASRLRIRPGSSRVERYPDGETGTRIEAEVSGRAVVIVQSTSPPVNDHLMELLVLVDAARRAGSASILAVVPYFGYARSDGRRGERQAVTGRLVASMLEAAGVTGVITVDAHTEQLEGFFRVPFWNLSAVPILADAVRDRIPDESVVVSPDLGRIGMAVEYGERFGVPAAAVHKRRLSGRRVESGQVLGDVRGRRCVIVDDMISTGGTIAECVKALREAGAEDGFTVVATHGVLTAGAIETLEGAGVEAVWTTDSIARIPGSEDRVHQASIAALVADAIQEAFVGTRS